MELKKIKKSHVMILSRWLFVKAMMIFFSYVLSDGNCNVNFELHLKIWMVVMVTIVFVDARWIESRFVVTAYNIEIVSCDFHGNTYHFCLSNPVDVRMSPGDIEMRNTHRGKVLGL